MKQLKLIKPQRTDHGGELRNKRSGRGMRQIATNSTMHFILRSSAAKGPWRFQANRSKWVPIVEKFAQKYGVKVISKADPGNHIHLHLKFSTRRAYRMFIRAITAAIAMAITGVSRWKKIDLKFWDLRPFSRIVIGRKGFEIVEDYVQLNRLESEGYSRETARQGVRNAREYANRRRRPPRFRSAATGG